MYPLPKFSGFRESFRFSGESVDRGYSVLVFPEGEVNNSETGEMAKFQSGIGLLAENLRIPIVPMRIEGVWKMKRERRRFALPSRPGQRDDCHQPADEQPDGWRETRRFAAAGQQMGQ